MNQDKLQSDGTHGGGAGYDAVPRDGPWLFVALADAWDRGEILGAWIRASASNDELLDILASATGRAVALKDVAIVDQTGLEQMAAETRP